MKQIDKVLEIARGELGYKERSDGWTKYGQWYADEVAHSQVFAKSDWCAMFVTWVMRKAGVSPEAYPDTSPQGSSVPYNISWMEAHGYRTGADDMPKPGDLVYYRWGASGWDHIGIVTEVSGTSANNAMLGVIEGNYNDMVSLRRIAYRDNRVAATCRIPYSSEEISVVPELSFLLKQGSRSQAVEVLQQALIQDGYELTGGVDGYFGQYTKEALVAFQQAHNLIADGTAGTETFGFITRQR